MFIFIIYIFIYFLFIFINAKFSSELKGLIQYSLENDFYFSVVFILVILAQHYSLARFHRKQI